MGRFRLRDLPPALAAQVGPAARLTFPPQGRTSDVALAAQRDRHGAEQRLARETCRDEPTNGHAVRLSLGIEVLIHGDLALDNVLVDGRGTLRLIDWAGGGPGDPRHDIALALDMKPEAELTSRVLDAFYAGYASAPLEEATREWFVRLYDYF